MAYNLFNNSYAAFATTDEMFDVFYKISIEYTDNRDKL